MLPWPTLTVGPRASGLIWQDHTIAAAESKEPSVSLQAARAAESCFVVMPFGGLWDDYYAAVYSPAITDAGLLPVRADEVFRAGSVLQDIVEFLSRCSVVLADITDANRNVHYELGLAHALGKPTVLVAPQEMELFFDIGQERIITYSKQNAFWGSDLRAALARALRETVANPASAIPTAFLHVKPTRVEVDETAMRLRRIEELLVDLSRAVASTGDNAPSRLRGLLKGLPAAEAEAEVLLARQAHLDAVRSLMAAGYGQVMAETAVANAAARMGKA
jgi:hypothetical protein